LAHIEYHFAQAIRIFYPGPRMTRRPLAPRARLATSSAGRDSLAAAAAAERRPRPLDHSSRGCRRRRRRFHGQCLVIDQIQLSLLSCRQEEFGL